jgi:hypothetical protein
MPTSSLTPLQDYCEGKILAATQDRDKYAADVTEALSSIQPSLHGLGRFYEATHAAFAAEAWTHFRKRPLDNALMEMHYWTNPSSLSPHPVTQMVVPIKAAVARGVVKDLTDQGLLDASALRIFVLGLHGIDG